MKGKFHTRTTRGLLLCCMLGLSGCTLERPFKTVLKEQVHDKSVIDTSADYLYLPSVVEAPRAGTATRPYWMGDAKLVRFYFAENNLKILEVDAEGRFKDNPTNQRPVLSIPVEHLEFRCTENSNGECTNQEEANNDITWANKNLFRPRFSSLEVLETNFLPIEIINLFEGCYQEMGQEFVGYELTDVGLNVQMEKTFRANGPCIDWYGLESLGDVNFRVRYHYSIVKASSLTSKDYKAISYQSTDERSFGFFTSAYQVLSSDNSDDERNQRVMMNRWNPKRGKITYLLNKPFQKVENKAIREATFSAVSNINETLKKAGAGISIDLQDAVDEEIGDLRHNFIVAVEDPLAVGLLGYGPSAAHPYTGEIVNGRTVMYLGIITRYVRRAYEELILERQMAATSTAAPSGVAAGVASTERNPFSSLEWLLSPLKTSLPANMSSMFLVGNTGLEPADKERFKREATKMLRDYTSRRDSVGSPVNRRIDLLSKYCLYSADLFAFDEAIEGDISSIENLPGGGKPWEFLTDEERQQVLAVLLPSVWTPILVHELGHNLGLRHNFQASEDKENHYTAEELEKLGVKHAVPYSSVMDYSYRTTNELPVMGKYDIAALRYGYARKVETAEGTVVSVPSTLAELEAQGVTLKPYGFCTDEHVTVNAGCKRFDEGSSYKEIAEHFVRMYEDGYQRRNFRNGLRKFSIYDEASYRGRLEYIFYSLRVFQEVMSMLQERYGAYSEADLLSVPWIKDLHDAAGIAGNFFLKILATPDLTCAISPQSAPGTITGLLPLSLIDQYVGQNNVSCFSPVVTGFLSDLGTPLLAVAQGGRSFRSLKDPLSDNPWADQIDVRGVKTDKEMALEYLLKRSLDVSIFDRYQMEKNFLHRADIAPELLSLFNQVLFDRLTVETTFSAQNGQTLVIPMMTTPSDTARELRGMVLNAVKKHVPSERHLHFSRGIQELFEVYRTLPLDRRAEELQLARFGSRTFYAVEENEVARAAISMTQIVRDLTPALEGLGEERFLALVALLKSGQKLPENATALEKRLEKYNVEVLENFLDGLFLTESQLLALLDSLLPSSP